MKSVTLICGLCIASLASCEENNKSARAMIDYSIPAGKSRAAAAAVNVGAALERDLTKAGLRLGDPVFIRAFKEEQALELFVRNRASGKFDLFKSYPIAAMPGQLGPKRAEGDGQVPEGFYFVPPAAMNPASQFHLSFNIGYPNSYDQARGFTGSAIMVHGNRVSIGCLAMTDGKIEEIYTLCAAAHQGGQAYFRVHLFPFRMSAERLGSSTANPNLEFWRNLKQGYDLFEQNRVPPDVSVAGGSYRFQGNF